MLFRGFYLSYAKLWAYSWKTYGRKLPAAIRKDFAGKMMLLTLVSKKVVTADVAAVFSFRIVLVSFKK